MPEAQAEVLADEHGRLLDERLATKADIAPLATNADFPVAKNDLQRQIRPTSADCARPAN